MPEEDIVEVEGKITAVLPSTMFRAELQMDTKSLLIFPGNSETLYKNNGWGHC